MLGKYLGKIRNQINNWDCNRIHLIAPSEEHTSYFSFVLHRATLCGPHSFSPKYSPKKSYKKMPKEEKYVLFHVQSENFHTLDKILLWRWCGACDKYEVVRESGLLSFWCVLSAAFLNFKHCKTWARTFPTQSGASSRLKNWFFLAISREDKCTGLIAYIGSQMFNHSNNSKGNRRQCLFLWMTK